MTINNINELAASLDWSISALKDNVREYTDYETVIDWDDQQVTLTTSVPETGDTLTKTLVFPFTDGDYDDAIVGLQCWADYKWCEHNKREV